VAIAPLAPALSADVTAVSINPDLTARTGLNFNSTSGVISGAPTLAKSGTYVLTAVDASGRKARASIAITVNAPGPTLSVAPGPFKFLLGAAIAPVLGRSVTAVSISPDLAANGACL